MTTNAPREKQNITAPPPPPPPPNYCYGVLKGKDKNIIIEENRIYWKNLKSDLVDFFKNIPDSLKDDFWNIAFSRDGDNFVLSEIIEYYRACLDTKSDCNIKDVIEIFGQ